MKNWYLNFKKRHASINRTAVFEFKQNVTRGFSKNVFMVKRTKKVFPMNFDVDVYPYLHVRINIKINNSFTIKNDKILPFESFNHASHLNTVGMVVSNRKCEKPPGI